MILLCLIAHWERSSWFWAYAMFFYSHQLSRNPWLRNSNEFRTFNFGAVKNLWVILPSKYSIVKSKTFCLLLAFFQVCLTLSGKQSSRSTNFNPLYFLANIDTLTALFIMCKLIINSKLATAGLEHFELQKYPLKENYMKKIAVSPWIQTWDQ